MYFESLHHRHIAATGCMDKCWPTSSVIRDWWPRGHATMLSIQHILGLPCLLTTSTKPIITLPSMLSHGSLSYMSETAYLSTYNAPQQLAFCPCHLLDLLTDHQLSLRYSQLFSYTIIFEGPNAFFFFVPQCLGFTHVFHDQLDQYFHHFHHHTFWKATTWWPCSLNCFSTLLSTRLVNLPPLIQWHTIMLKYPIKINDTCWQLRTD